LICDEIQTGLGRTGKLMAYEHDGIKPDALVLGKALGGGLLPVSAFLTSKAVMDVFTPGDHGSTFGGNPLAAAVGEAALQVLVEEKFSERANEVGHYFREQLRTIHSPLIKDVRGKGLLIGLEVDKRHPAHDICVRLLPLGILTKETHGTVIRFAPPLIITKEQIDVAVSALKKVFADVDAELQIEKQAK
jgi:ornithine--oxo-acid transaminase